MIFWLLFEDHLIKLVICSHVINQVINAATKIELDGPVVFPGGSFQEAVFVCGRCFCHDHLLRVFVI